MLLSSIFEQFFSCLCLPVSSILSVCEMQESDLSPGNSDERASRRIGGSGEGSGEEEGEA